MGVVYKTLDTSLNRYVAIKVLPAELTTDPEGGVQTLLVEERSSSTLLDLRDNSHNQMEGDTVLGLGIRIDILHWDTSLVDRHILTGEGERKIIVP